MYRHSVSDQNCGGKLSIVVQGARYNRGSGGLRTGIKMRDMAVASNNRPNHLLHSCKQLRFAEVDGAINLCPNLGAQMSLRKSCSIKNISAGMERI